MSYEFEGKKYASVKQVHTEHFPTRSEAFVRTYLKVGAKSVVDVVRMSEESFRTATKNRKLRQERDRQKRK